MDHTDSVRGQLLSRDMERPEHGLMAGHKKDIILSGKIYEHDYASDRVVIYGWHRGDKDPIQPVYNGHASHYADYSHGVRVVAKTAMLNGRPVQLEEILKDPLLSKLLSDEGPLDRPGYPVDAKKVIFEAQ